MRRTTRAILPGALLLAATLAGCAGLGDFDGLRLGYFPNVTHAQALYGVQTGLYARELGAHPFTATQFNAGPTAVEALLTGQVDAAYVGPSPVINALSATGDGTLRIVAGAASGGARFILRGDVQVASDADLAGKTFATPQLGNTQDVSLKDWLKARGHATKDVGGDVTVVNAANPDILTLFRTRQLHGAWLPEPWATRLEQDEGGHELLDERSLWPGGRFATTVLVTTKAYLDRHPGHVRALLEAHVAATAALRGGNASALQAVNDGLAQALGKPLPAALLAEAATKLEFTNDPLAATLESFAGKARGLGFLAKPLPPLGQAVDLGPLNEVLARHGRPGVPAP